MKNDFAKFLMLAGLSFSPFITGRGMAAWGSPAVAQQRQTVKGTVVDEKGEPLIGVTVTFPGQKGGAVTDIDGHYSIEAPRGAQLRFSYVGYADQTLSVSGSQMNVTLSVDNKVLDEVVVVGYGTQKKSSLTGAVTVVDSRAFNDKGGLSSPLEALQGQVPGVMITRSSSAPGDESWSMNLRGSSSINSTEPLIIIDGVATNSVSELRLLNPNDIQSINFLKDGAAAIYGSRAAGGVVLITTKKGEAGKLKINYEGSATLRTVGLMPTLCSIDQWADGVSTALENDNNTSNVWYTYVKLAKKYKGGYINLRETANPFGQSAFQDVNDFVFDDKADWLGSLFGSSWSTNHSISLTGGTEKSDYRLSFNYLYDGSTLQYGDNNNQRFNVRFNNTYQFNRIFSLESSVAYNRQEQVAPTLIGSALTVSMPMPGLPLTARTGKPYAWGTWGSPVAKLEGGGNNHLSVSAINIAEDLKMHFADWLDGDVTFGYNTSNADRMIFANSITYYDYAEDATVMTEPTEAMSYSQETSARTDFYSLSGYLTAHHTWAKRHNTSLTFGAQYEMKNAKYFGINATDILDGLSVVNGSGTVTSVNNTGGNYKTSNMSYFGRFNYDYDGRYLIEFNGRYDGSSKFQPENRWAFFWGASGGWRINEEQFLRNVTWLSNLKLRLSYAQMGSQSGIDNYDGFQFYNLNANSGAYVGGDKLTYIATNGKFASTTRQWERIHNYNVGLDFGFLGNTVVGTVDFFMKRNNNMLVAMTYPAIVGDAAPTANKGKFKDWGWEGSLTYNGRVGSQFHYHVGGTFTFARNRLIYYGGTTVLSSGYTSTKQGYPINSLFGLRYGGKIQNEKQLEAYKTKYYTNNGVEMPSNLRAGDNMYCDENRDGKLDYNDYIYLGSSTPEISYSFNFGAEWKGLSLNVVFQGAANRFVYRGINAWTVPFRSVYTNTTTASFGNTWTPENAEAYYSPYTVDSKVINYDYQASSLTAQDGRYLRLKGLTLSYSLPASLIHKIGAISGARVYFTGSDLWESTRIKDGWDPEAAVNPSGTQRYPFTRSFTFGLGLTF